MKKMRCPGCSDTVDVLPSAQVEHPCPARKRKRTEYLPVPPLETKR